MIHVGDIMPGVRVPNWAVSAILSITLVLISGAAAAAPTSLPSTRFSWPLAWPFGYPRLRIAEYVDDDHSPVSQTDYMGGSLTYEGHLGTDLDVNSFRDMDAGVPVLAAANGRVLGTEDEQFDRQISLPPVLWNYVSILHEDGTISIYGHLRKHSVAVRPGEYVREGQIIALMGSSGSTWMPHLHFEVAKWNLDSNGIISTERLDPWSGPQNPTPSMWKHQEDYVGDDHFRLLDLGVTTLAAIQDEGGTAGDQSAFKERPSQPAAFGASERFLKVWTLTFGQIGDPYRIEIRKPDGSLFNYIDAVVQPTAWNAGRGWQLWDIPFSGLVAPSDYGMWSAVVLSGDQTVTTDSFLVGATSTYGPRFHWLAGKSFHLSQENQYDTLLVSTRLGAPYQDLTFSLENAPSNVSMAGTDAVGRKLVLIGPPGPDLAGVRSYQFDALVTDPSGLTDRKYYQLINYDASTLGSPPIVAAPGSVTVTEGDTLTIQVSASDPDGDAIANLFADLSNMPPGSGAVFVADPDHTTGKLTWRTTIGQSGGYSADFIAVTSLGGGEVPAFFGYEPFVQTSYARTAITVQKAVQARGFTRAADKTIRLFSDKPDWCAYVEPVHGSFALEDIDPATVTLVSHDTGSVEQIPVGTGKRQTVGDRNRNSIPDEAFCFAIEDLRRLFDRISGRHDVTPSIQGRLTSGEQFSAGIDLSVIATDEGDDETDAQVSPNPLNPQGTLTIRQSKRGPLRVQLFDTRGRLVRTLLATDSSPAGKIEVRVDGHDATGGSLASGVYLLRVSTSDRVTTVRFVVLK